MIKDLKVKITRARLGDNCLYVDFEAEIVYDNGSKETLRDDLSLDKEERSEETVKERIIDKIEKHCADVQGREFASKIEKKTYKNEDFAFSKIFSGKKDG